MAYKIQSSVLPLLLIVLVLNEPTTEGRDFPGYTDQKHADWLIAEAGTMFIPGIGRIPIPPYYSGNLGGLFGPFSNYIPRGDDGFMPNPGFEFPYPERDAVASANVLP